VKVFPPSLEETKSKQKSKWSKRVI